MSYKLYWLKRWSRPKTTREKYNERSVTRDLGTGSGSYITHSSIRAYLEIGALCEVKMLDNKLFGRKNFFNSVYHVFNSNLDSFMIFVFL